MLRCWETKPEERPSFSSLERIMKEMERKHEVGSLILFAKYVLVIICLLVISPDALGVSNHNCSNLCNIKKVQYFPAGLEAVLTLSTL